MDYGVVGAQNSRESQFDSFAGATLVRSCSVAAPLDAHAHKTLSSPPILGVSHRLGR